MTKEGKSRAVAFPGDHHQPSAPPQPQPPPPPPYYYGTFLGVINQQQPYPPPPALMTYQPSLRFPQPIPPSNIHINPYYPHGYQTVPAKRDPKRKELRHGHQTGFG